MLLQLMEPGQTPLPHETEKRVAVGIDLGTTHSLVAVVEKGQPRIIRDEQGRGMLPSVVSYADLVPVVGHLALAHLSAYSPLVLTSFKRYMQQAEQRHHFTLNQRSVTPIEASAEILKVLKDRAEQDLGHKVTQAVITVPAYFDDAARTATRAAARLAGLDVLRLINEPTAAALAYGLENQSQGIYAVYDLGGGTFDFSLLALEGHFFKVLATGGDSQLGGDDIDQVILQHFNLPSDAPELRAQARHIKEYLTDHEEWQGSLGSQTIRTLTRGTLENLMTPLLVRTLKVCRQVLRDAALETSEIKGIVLVGGATRMPLLRQKVKEVFNQEPLINLNPDEVVALGAAIQAHALTQGAAHLLLDVNPLSLGLETYGDLVEKIIPRNSPLPSCQSQEFTTFQDNQTAISFHIVQGEREMVQDCRSLARFELKDIPPLPAGHARIKVTFMLDADGILTVSAQEQTTGHQQTIEVKPSYGLGEKELQKMIHDSHLYAHQDDQARAERAATIEKERLTQLVNKLFKDSKAES